MGDRLIKILSLGVGLAMAMILIAKVSFELSYDKCYADSDRLYAINEDYVLGDGETGSGRYVSGGVAPAYKAYIPQVESATRCTSVSSSATNHDEEGNAIEGELWAADSSFFKVFDWSILSGRVEDALARWNRGVMVSRSFAEKLGGVEEAIGKMIWNDTWGKVLMFTVKGVFEDFPVNSSLHQMDICCAIDVMGEWSINNMVGNDRYSAYVKLTEGTDPESLGEAVERMRKEVMPLDELEKSGVSLTYSLRNLGKLRLDEPTVRTQVVVLSIVAALLLILSVMNYVLLAIGDVVRRGKEVGVRRCYGAEGRDIYGLMAKETAFDILSSLVVAALLILAFRGSAESLLGVSVADLCTKGAGLAIAAMIVVAFVVSAVIPATMYLKIPVSNVFRGYSDSKRRWKLGLLAVQFAINAALVSLLIIVSLQYRKALRSDVGYDYSDILYAYVVVGDDDKRSDVAQRLEALPFVEGTALTFELPFETGSGDNVTLPGDDKKLFNASDPYEATPEYFDLMGFRLLEGSWPKVADEVAVSESFRTSLITGTGWADGIVGKQVHITGHGIENFTISGVYADYIKGALNGNDQRPGMFFMNPRDTTLCNPLFNICLKVSEMNAENIAAANAVLKEAYPDDDLEFVSYAESFKELYSSTRNMKRTYTLGSIIALIIALVGLVGYVRDESFRRSKEIAVRKVNGAVTGEIVSMLVKDMLKIAVAAVAVGDVLAWLVADRWLQQFSERLALNPLYFIIADVAVLLIVAATVVANSLSIASGDPVESLKNE